MNEQERLRELESAVMLALKPNSYNLNNIMNMNDGEAMTMQKKVIKY